MNKTAIKKKEKAPPSALKQMEASIHEAILAPFEGRQVWVIARRLSVVQVKSCGDFSLIETLQDKIDRKVKEGKEVTFDEIVKVSELQHNIIKESLLNPSYNQIIDMVLKYDDVSNLDDQLKYIEDKLQYLEKTDFKGIKKLQEEYAQLELRYRYVMPADFIAFIFSFALGLDYSDIKKVTENMLYSAAVKAKLGHDNPADHLKGLFTEFNKEDINDRAWIEYYKKHGNNKEQRG